PDFPDPFHAGFQQGKTFSASSITQLHRKLPDAGAPASLQKTGDSQDQTCDEPAKCMPGHPNRHDLLPSK
ncbi:MAG: hypothetical protein ACOYOS_22015, partial [Syntrophales bacterium]